MLITCRTDACCLLSGGLVRKIRERKSYLGSKERAFFEVFCFPYLGLGFGRRKDDIHPCRFCGKSFSAFDKCHHTMGETSLLHGGLPV